MRTLRGAWTQALYGPAGRFTTGGRDFRTALTDPVTAPAMAAALTVLAHRVDAALGHPDPFDVVDIGAGTGAWLAHLAATGPPRWRLHGVELAPRPAGLPPRVRWTRDIPRSTGLLLAHEWLDDVPCTLTCDGLELYDDGAPRPVPPDEQAWLARWWPGWRDGDAESGLARDTAWAAAVGNLDRGIAVAVDYGHDAGTRRATRTGWRAGRQVSPVCDGTCDVTAHVALDSLAAAVPGSMRLTQRDALAALGVGGPLLQPVTAATLARANAEAALRDPGSYGGFGWVLAGVGLHPGSIGLCPRLGPSPPPTPES